MIAQNRAFCPPQKHRLRIAPTEPEPRTPDTRISNPGVTDEFAPPPGLKPAADATLRRSRAVVEARARQELTQEQKAWVAENVTLRGYYDHFVAPGKRIKLSAGQVRAGTLQKDRQALNRWEKYTRPDDWPANQPWEGLVIGAIDGEDLEEFFERARGPGGLAAATVRSTWFHLRTTFNFAWRHGVLGRHLQPDTLAEEDGEVAIFDDERIEAAYGAFGDRTDLQVAFVLSILCGPRTEDVFGLRWDGVKLIERAGPTLVYTARKTGKQHGVPLCEVAVQHLRRLPRRGEYLFPTLCEPGHKDPARSRTARERNAEIKRRLLSVGITFRKPFQAARATCNERLESHKQGVGQFVLGHALSLNSKSYRKPDKMIRDAINSLAPPACFTRFETGCEVPREFRWEEG